MNIYKTSDFDYELPADLVAKFPLPERSGSRLLVVDRKAGLILHRSFKDLPEYLNPNDLMVFNNTKVIPARMYGRKESGGKIECLIERVLDEHRALAHIKASKSPKVGSRVSITSSRTSAKHAIRDLIGTIISRQDALFEIRFNEKIDDILNQVGEIPLPHYMERSAEKSDLERYQTVYAKEKGAVAAPTAGLHFDNEMLEAIKNKNVISAEVTLHVGAGTFQPVRVDDLSEHHMHSERMTLNANVSDSVRKSKRVIAVGTTSVRCLETAAQKGEINPYTGETDIFIFPGYQFKCVDALLTNFHLPKSTLMMLVTAFGGYELMMQAYQEAVKECYRFYSYGDAMLII